VIDAAEINMAQTANMTAREISMQRRRLSYETGKAGLQRVAGSQDRTRSDEIARTGAVAKAVSKPVAASAPAAKAAPMPAAFAPAAPAQTGKRIINPTRAASLARRQAMSSAGKAALKARAGTAETTRGELMKSNHQATPTVQTVQQQTAGVGRIGSMERKIRPTGRMRPGRETGAARDANWKVGASQTTHGQTVTGTRLGQSAKVTGEDPGLAGEITGTDYDSADVPQTPRKVSVTSTSIGNSISGTNFNRSSKVTGDEPGTCKNITGNQYVGAEQANEFCNPTATGGKRQITGNNPARMGKVTGNNRVAKRNSAAAASVTSSANGARGWAKRQQGTTLLGGTVTGTRVSHGASMTGDLRGACMNVTGDEYVGQETYNTFCESTPARTERKVNVSSTFRGQAVTGTLAGRESKVTGDEPGTCQSVTGTPYTGADSYSAFCAADDTAMANTRTRRGRATPGMPMTGLQPGIGGKLTGAGNGACEALTGTPYVGADDFAEACGTAGGENDGYRGGFSIDAPSHGSRTAAEHSAITGTAYERGRITGPFGLATGKVTGTDDARFGNGGASETKYSATTVDSRVKSRISGEGQDAGLRITGDDWDRNERVTGTEGLSSTRRNLTRRGSSGSMAMEQARQKRNEQLPQPNSKVTGSSGNTEKGSLVTYSGGARG